MSAAVCISDPFPDGNGPRMNVSVDGIAVAMTMYLMRNRNKPWKNSSWFSSVIVDKLEGVRACNYLPDGVSQESKGRCIPTAAQLVVFHMGKGR